MRFLQASLVFLVVVFLTLIGSVVYGQNGDSEPGFFISKDTGIALGTVLVLIAAIASLAFKAGYSARRHEELETRIAKLEKEAKV